MMQDPPQPCPTCGGQDGRREHCQTCEGIGLDVLTRCPLDVIGADAWDALMAADLAEKGTWPVLGGWLEQTQKCIESVRLVWKCTAYWKSLNKGK